MLDCKLAGAGAGAEFPGLELGFGDRTVKTFNLVASRFSRILEPGALLWAWSFGAGAGSRGSGQGMKCVGQVANGLGLQNGFKRS